MWTASPPPRPLRSAPRRGCRATLRAVGAAGLLAGCPKPAAGPGIAFEELSLPPVPASVAHVTWEGGPDGAAGRAPAHLEVLQDRGPRHLRLEDRENARVFEVLLEEPGDPARFGQVPGASQPDQGRALVEGNRLSVDLTRNKGHHSERLQIVVVDAPEPTPPPDDWLRPGTVLFYGVTHDNKPITKVVPLALTVRLGVGSDGSRVLTWSADIDPEAEAQFTTARTRTGRNVIAKAIVEDGVRLDDGFVLDEDIPDANSLFLSQAQLQGVRQLGGASFHDEALGRSGVLVRAFDLQVDVQADAGMWSVPAVAAWTAGGEAVYVVAQDPTHPLLLSARRPGTTIRLLAIGTPAPRY